MLEKVIQGQLQSFFKVLLHCRGISIQMLHWLNSPRFVYSLSAYSESVQNHFTTSHNSLQTRDKTGSQMRLLLLAVASNTLNLWYLSTDPPPECSVWGQLYSASWNSCPGICFTRETLIASDVPCRSCQLCAASRWETCWASACTGSLFCRVFYISSTAAPNIYTYPISVAYCWWINLLGVSRSFLHLWC